MGAQREPQTGPLSWRRLERPAQATGSMPPKGTKAARTDAHSPTDWSSVTIELRGGEKDPQNVAYHATVLDAWRIDQSVAMGKRALKQTMKTNLIPESRTSSTNGKPDEPAVNEAAVCNKGKEGSEEIKKGHGSPGLEGGGGAHPGDQRNDEGVCGGAQGGKEEEGDGSSLWKGMAGHSGGGGAKAGKGVCRQDRDLLRVCKGVGRHAAAGRKMYEKVSQRYTKNFVKLQVYCLPVVASKGAWNSIIKLALIGLRDPEEKLVVAPMGALGNQFRDWLEALEEEIGTRRVKARRAE